MEMPSRRTNNFPESGRGLGHVTPTIFGSTVGYPSDSLACCSFYHATAYTICLARYMLLLVRPSVCLTHTGGSVRNS